MFLNNMKCMVLFTKLFPHFSFSPQGIEIKKSEIKNLCYFSGKSHCNFTDDFHTIFSFISKDIFNSVQYLLWPHQYMSYLLFNPSYPP